jgi:hypothetical protein
MTMRSIPIASSVRVIAAWLACCLALPTSEAASQAKVQEKSTPAPAENASVAVGHALTYTLTITSHGLNAEGKPLDYEEMLLEQLAGDNARITFFDATVTAPPDGSAPPANQARPKFYGHGAYYLVRRGGSTITVVSPAQKKYFELPGDQAAEQSLGKLLHMQFSNVSIGVERIQPDTGVQEMQAHHWRITDTYTQKVSVLLISATSHVQWVMDYYMVPDFKDDIDPFVHVGGILTYVGSQDYRTKMQAALAQMEPGVPILSVERMTSTDNRGAGQSMLVSRVTNISRDTVPASVFAIPAGYTKSNHETLPTEVAGYPSSITPGIAAGETNGQSAGQAAATGAKQAILKGLKIP